MKILLNIGYDTHNKYEPYDSITEVLHLDDNMSNKEIEYYCYDIAKSIAGDYLRNYTWEEYND